MRVVLMPCRLLPRQTSYAGYFLRSRLRIMFGETSVFAK